MVHLVDQLGRLRSAGVRFIASSQSIDTDESNPTSRLLLHILGAVAEFERELTRERVAIGLKRYRDDYESGHVGKKGRHSHSGKDLKWGRPRKVFARYKVAGLHKAGWSLRAIAAKLNVSLATIQRQVSALK
jgi:DNA invertase Pin-like site-specific DNA recombinase